MIVKRADKHVVAEATGRGIGNAMRPRGAASVWVGACAMLLTFATVTATSQAQVSNPEGRGAMVFQDQGCPACHTVGSLGPPTAPDLSRVGAKYSAEYLRGWLSDPKSRRPWAHMPNLQLTWPEIDALAEYLASQR